MISTFIQIYCNENEQNYHYFGFISNREQKINMVFWFPLLFDVFFGKTTSWTIPRKKSRSRRLKIPKNSQGFCENPGDKTPETPKIPNSGDLPRIPWNLHWNFQKFQIPIPIPGISGFSGFFDLTQNKKNPDPEANSAPKVLYMYKWNFLVFYILYQMIIRNKNGVSWQVGAKILSLSSYLPFINVVK